MNIILIGFMGSGKTTTANHLSNLTGFQVVDMDNLACSKTKTQNMNELFAKGGELLLRETEIEIAQEYAPKNNLIISTGGGVVLNKIILDYFKKEGGKVVFLNADFKEILKRLDGDQTRPLLKNIQLAEDLYHFRLPLYSAYADETIDVNTLSAETIALKIKELFYGF